ncbi:MAG: glycosyltransferase family 4 protein [Sphingomonadaceae bacterium]
MRILLVSDYAYPAGGVETMLQLLRDQFRSHGHDVRVFGTALETRPNENFADYRCLGTTSPLRTLLQTANPWASRAFAQALADFKPDIVHIRMFLTQLSPLILNRLRGHRAVYHLAWYRAICPTGRKMLPGGMPCERAWGTACLKEGCVPLRDWPLMMAQLRMTHRRLDRFQAVIANSTFVKTVMARDGIASDVIHNGVAIDPIETVARADQPTILFAGRLTSEKGCQNLLQAVARLRQGFPYVQLVVAGDGPFRAVLEAACADLGIADAVTFLGHLGRAALRVQTRRAWVQVVPSLWDEPFGIAALDGMAQARPVIASAAGGLQEIVVDGVTGHLVPPGDVAVLADRLSALLADPQRCQTMGEAGRNRLVAHFSIEKCASSFLDLYVRMMMTEAR